MVNNIYNRLNNILDLTLKIKKDIRTFSRAVLIEIIGGGIILLIVMFLCFNSLGHTLDKNFDKIDKNFDKFLNNFN